MTEGADSGRPDREDLCSWCGNKLTREERERREGRVCVRCQRLLNAAGISDEDIFGEQPPEED